MKVIEYHGLVRVTKEYEYTPTVEELYYWYSGTHAGYTPNNPYNLKKTSCIKTKYTKVVL